MSTFISTAVWQHSKAKATGLLVLLSLADQANDEGWCWPSVETIARRCRISVRTVQRFLGELEEIGEITREERPGTSTRYHIAVTPDNLSPRQSVRGDNSVTGGVTTVSPRNINEPKEPTGSSAPAPVDNSQTLIAEWIDHCPGGRPPGRVVGQVAKEISAMLEEGIPYEQVRRGLAAWQNKRLHPSVLASVVHEMRTANGHSQPAKERIICKTCQRPEVACRRVARQTGDDHEWMPSVVKT